MTEFAKMDLFFIVTTASVVVLTLLVVVILVFLARLFATLNTIATEVEEEAEAIRADLAGARTKAKRDGLKFADVLSFFGKTASRTSRGTKKKRSS